MSLPLLTHSQELAIRMAASLEAARHRLLKRVDKVFHRFKQTNPAGLEKAEIVTSVCEMAQQAFGAYNDPSEGSGFRENTSQGHEIHFLNAASVDRAVEGVLKIHLDRAQNVKSSDMGWWNASDPFVVFSHGSSIVKSATINDTRSPVWDSTHYLVIRKQYIKNVYDDKLNIKVFDDDTEENAPWWRSLWEGLWRDDVLGVTSIDMEDLKKPGPHTFIQKTLTESVRSKRGSLNLTFTVEFVSFQDAFNETNAREETLEWLNRHDSKGDPLSVWTSSSLPNMLYHVPLNPFAFINVPSTDTQVWVCVSKEELHVAFRGTEMDKLQDILLDLKAWPTELRSTLHRNYLLDASAELMDDKIQVHAGFLDAYESVREALLQLIYDVTQWKENWIVRVTGHSLGGALATLCAFEIANRKNSEGTGPLVRMVNFGAPRVGNEAFVNLYNKTVPHTHRVVEKDDPVTKLPPLFYAHVDKKLVCQSNGQLTDGHRSIFRQTSRALHGRRKQNSETLRKLVSKYRKRLPEMIHKHFAKTYFSHLRLVADDFFHNRLPTLSHAEE